MKPKTVKASIIVKLKDGSTSRLKPHIIYLDINDNRKGHLSDGRPVNMQFGKWYYQPV